MEFFAPPKIKFNSKGKEVAVQVEKATILEASPFRSKQVNDGFGSLQFEQESLQLSLQNSNVRRMALLSLETSGENDVLAPWKTNPMASTSKDPLPDDQYILLTIFFN